MLPESKILLSGRFSAEDINIIGTDTSSRKIVPEIESRLSHVWEENSAAAQKAGKLIYDGESFRLEKAEIVEGKLELTVSKFKYSVRSALVALAPQLLELGIEYTGNGLAIGGFIKTTDGKYIFGEKSGKTTSTAKVDFIGGMLEPKVLKDGKDLIEYNEVEIEEESGIKPEDIESIVITGLIYTPTSNIIILTETNLRISSEEVLERFRDNNDGEMTRLIFKNESELVDYVREIGSYKPQALELLNNK